MTCERKPGAKPAIPPGIRMQIEAGERRLRELGITQEFLDGIFSSNDAYFLVRKVLAEALLYPHRKEGWFARRRLKRTLSANWHAPADHLARCAPCRAWTAELVAQLAALIEKPPSE